MAIFGSLKSVEHQLRSDACFRIAFEYANRALTEGSEESKRIHALEVGKTFKFDLPGGAFALEQAFISKARPEGFFEAHRKYIDVQIVVSGIEHMEVTETSRLTIAKLYDDSRDVVIYSDTNEVSTLIVRPTEVAVFFPVDGHMPSLHSQSGPALVRKTVVKVPVA